MPAITRANFESVLDSHQRITQTFVGREFGWDRMDDVNWELLLNNVLAARRVLSNPAKFPKANFDACEQMDQEGTAFLLKGPIQYFAALL